MTFDLFADEPVAVAPAPAPAVASLAKQQTFGEPQGAVVRLPGEVFMMEPTQLNRWLYRGEVVIYDGREVHPKGRGRWSTIDTLDHAAEFREERIELCRLIDSRLNTPKSATTSEAST